MSEQATAQSAGSGGLNWGNLMEMLGGFMKKPENQRMIVEMVKPLTQRFDPGTGRMVGGIGTGMLDAGSAIINREEVGKTASAQALREQLYNQQRLAQQKQLIDLYTKQLAGQVQPAQGTSSQLGWDSNLMSDFLRGTAPRETAETDQQRRFKMAQGGY